MNLKRKLYDVIYADPPWMYDYPISKSRRVESHYKTMKIEDICALEVLAKEDSVLYLWATSPKLLEALKVMKVWGFKYVTSMMWDKRPTGEGRTGMGHWSRVDHEFLLIGIRGKFSPPSIEHRISSVWRINKTGHSVKPIEVRDWIRSAFPGASCLEMFAHTRAEGWDYLDDEGLDAVKS